MDPPRLIELDLRIKNGDGEEDDDDLELVDGAVVVVVASRVKGGGLAVSITSLIHLEGYEKYQGTVDRPLSSLRRLVVAVVTMGTEMFLSFKVAGDDDDRGQVERCLSFKAEQHGSDRQWMSLDGLADVLVK
ncbi:hypothetical protein U9M48_034709, partial [Paspalum notatum var. saurae]